MSEFTEEDRKILIRCETILCSVNKRLGDHERRIRKLHDRQIFLVGWGSAVGLAIGMAWQYMRLK